MISIQSILHSVEEGEGRILVRIIPFVVTLVVLCLVYDYTVFHGLNDGQSMDNAQLARQIYRHQGFTTRFIRPAALSQLSNKNISQSILGGGHATELFPRAQFPAGTPRILPDTYNPPLYPYLLAGWFHLFRPNFVESAQDTAAHHMYAGDRVIPWLNQLLLLLTALNIFILGRRLFDDRVAWISLLAFLASDIVWQYSLSALSTSLLMFLITAAFFAAAEIYRIGEACFESTEASFRPAWIWTAILGLLLGLACLARLDLLILLVPFAAFFILVPRVNYLLIPLVLAIPLLMVAPWFWHMYQVSGSPLGSNVPLLHQGGDEFKGNQIYCSLAIPNYEQLFKDVSKKEYAGYAWNLEHLWQLLGVNPMILLFLVSILHHFRRSRVQAIRWLIIGCAVLIIGADSLCNSSPEPVGPWNTLVVLFPCMVVVGTSFFFILLDRLSLDVHLFNTMIVVAILAFATVPLLVTVTTRSGSYYNYPPYAPAYIKLLGTFDPADQWVTTDMPWAFAWYGDRSSLWLPDTVDDFNEIYDNYCPSGLLILTPVLLSQPANNLTIGEDKDWFPFVTGFNIPAHFPLNGHAPTAAGSPEYIIWGPSRRRT